MRRAAKSAAIIKTVDKTVNKSAGSGQQLHRINRRHVRNQAV